MKIKCPQKKRTKFKKNILGIHIIIIARSWSLRSFCHRIGRYLYVQCIYRGQSSGRVIQGDPVSLIILTLLKMRPLHNFLLNVRPSLKIEIKNNLSRYKYSIFFAVLSFSLKIGLVVYFLLY